MTANKLILLSILGIAMISEPRCLGGAKENAELRQQQVVDLLKRETARITAGALSGIESLEDWRTARPQKRREYLYMLGLDPMPEKAPLRSRVTGRLEREDYTVDKVVFESMPGLYVTGNLYLPRRFDAPMPAILYVCGHSPHPLGAKYHYQDRAQWFARNGYACLAIDTLEFGEVAGVHHGLHNLNMWRWLSLGYTPAGVEVWNAIRAIDYLETRKEVDPGRIGITGISGGGAVSWFAAAADERIAVSVPVCGTFTFGSQAEHWLADGQCDCIYFNNTFQSDLTVVAALIAPRPLLFCSGRRDSIFPPDGYEEVYRQASRVYDLHSKPERIRQVDDDVPHQDSPLLRQETRQWMNRWLKGGASPVERIPNPEDKEIAAEELACLVEPPRDALNYGVHDSFVPTAELRRFDSKAEWEKRRRELIAELKDKTFRWLPSESIPFQASSNGGYAGWMDRYGDYKDVQIQSEKDSFIRVQLVKSRDRSSNPPLLIYVKRDTDGLSFVDVDELLSVFGVCDVAFLNPRLTDQQASPQEYANIERTAVWAGRTVAAMQTWDILRAYRWLNEEEKLGRAQTILFAKDGMTVPALYAMLLEEGVDQLVARDLPDSHWNAPPLLNVLRFTDIPEVAAALAPRRLTLLRRKPPGFDMTEAIYQLYHENEKFSTARSLREAIVN